ncbi:MAG: hypothetical protein ACYTFQ_10630 [Planctomycetota bacterium]|jgi:hypothetical protein
MEHFKFATIPAEEWWRLKGTTAKGNEGDRPHFVPMTEEGRKFAEIMASGFFSCGLCPGGILIDGVKTTGFRFIHIEEEVVPEMLDDLNRQVEKFFQDSV